MIADVFKINISLAVIMLLLTGCTFSSYKTQLTGLAITPPAESYCTPHQELDSNYFDTGKIDTNSSTIKKRNVYAIVAFSEKLETILGISMPLPVVNTYYNNVKRSHGFPFIFLYSIINKDGKRVYLSSSNERYKMSNISFYEYMVPILLLDEIYTQQINSYTFNISNSYQGFLTYTKETDLVSIKPYDIKYLLNHGSFLKNNEKNEPIYKPICRKIVPFPHFFLDEDTGMEGVL
ncbi:hypothetical protein [Zooshikella harenae]|uniref:Lipoprotein n=1 Tax=Zooshikella harenae TaxID=2827238 RepID=A0ABS5ZKK0_9GAMM|nr:hypothetical protein [Zooshikella harenae]MBU2713790.1 hypothetical protein [Zooshikella harenae]